MVSNLLLIKDLGLFRNYNSIIEKIKYEVSKTFRSVSYIIKLSESGLMDLDVPGVYRESNTSHWL